MSARQGTVLPRWLYALLLLLLGSKREWALGDLEERERSRRAHGRAGRLRLARDSASTASWAVAARLTDASRYAAGFSGEIRLSARSLLRRPGYAAGVVSTLALGIGTVAAAFTIVDGVVLRPLAFPEPEGLTRLYRTVDSVQTLDFSAPQVESLQRLLSPDVAVGGFSRAARSLRAPGSAPHNVGFARVTPGFLETLRAQPLLGRLPNTEELRDGAPVIVLSEGLWRTLFASDPNVFDASVDLDEVSHTVVGVLPAAHGFPEDAELWRPLTADERAEEDAELTAVARIPAHTTWEVFTTRLSAATAAARVDARDTGGSSGARAVPLKDAVVGPVRTGLLVLLGASACVLLVAVANAVSLQFVRSMELRRDAAVRTALGATGARVVRGLVAESALLAALGWGLGIGLAALAVPIVKVMAPGVVPGLANVRLDTRVAMVVGAVSALAVLLGAVGPAWSTARRALGTLRVGEGILAGRLRLGTLRAVVSAQLGFTTALVVSAGLLAASFHRLLTTDRGFDSEHLLVMPLSLSSAAWDSPGGLVGFSALLLERTASLPGVVDVAVASHIPGVGRGLNPVIVGLSELSAGTREAPVFGVQTVSPSFFATTRIAIVEGRALPEASTTASAAVDPVVVNGAFARAFLGAEPWLGRRIPRDDGSGGKRDMEVVGVSADVVTAPGEDAPPVLYVSTGSVPIFEQLLVRLDPAAPAAATVSAVYDAVLELDPGQPVNVSTWMTDELGRPGARTRFQAWLMSAFGALALTLAAVGIYGMAAYGASQRRAELGLRRALGAHRTGILALALSRALGTSVVGIALGLVGAALASRLLQGLLFGVSPFEPLVYVAGATGLGVVALLASLAPALRAAHNDEALATLLREG